MPQDGAYGEEWRFLKPLIKEEEEQQISNKVVSKYSLDERGILQVFPCLHPCWRDGRWIFWWFLCHAAIC